MPVKIQCHQCSAVLRVRDDVVASTVTCPCCGAELPVDASETTSSEPALGFDAESLQEEHDEFPALFEAGADGTDDDVSDPWADVADDDLSQRSEEDAAEGDAEFEDIDIDSSIDDEGEFADEIADASLMPVPVRKRKKKRRTKHLTSDHDELGSTVTVLTANIRPVNVVLLVAGGVLLVWGLRQMWPGLTVAGPPVEVAYTDLLSDGPGDQQYFILSDVIPLVDGYVVERDGGGNVTGVWIPCVVSESIGSFDFVLYSGEVSSDAEIEELAFAATHSGMIISGLIEPQTDRWQLLSDAGIDPDNAWFFDVDRQPTGSVRSAGMIIAGLVLMLLAMAWMFLLPKVQTIHL